MQKTARKGDATREKLLITARRMMWARGYSAVTLRAIAQEAGVDVALISRYFGNKRGLFEATLHDAFTSPRLNSPRELIDAAVSIFVTAPRNSPNPSPVRLLLMNMHDAEVGALVRQAHYQGWQRPVIEVLQSEERAALFMAAILGFSIVEKSLYLEGVAPVGSPEYDAQLRHILRCSITV